MKIIKDQRGAISTGLGILLGLILAAVAALVVWLWQQQSIDDLNRQVDELQQQIEEFQPETQTQENNADQPDATEADVTYTSENGVKVVVTQPQANAQVSSPLQVRGEVPGNWSFEASFPIELRNEDGTMVAEGIAQLQGDWMTEDMVPFTATLEYSESKSGQGELILMRANASGLPENDDYVGVPVQL